MTLPQPPALTTIRDSLAGSRFVKVTGPAGDWIVFADTSNTLTLTPDQVVSLCDRRHGVGASGTVVMTSADDNAAPSGARHHLVAWDAGGSVIEDMTEPARAATGVLAALGRINSHDTSHHAFQTDTDLVTTVYTPAYIGVDVGQWAYIYPETATAAGSDALVMTAGLTDPRPGLSIRILQDHIMIAVETHEELEAIDLSQQPSIEPAPEHPTTVGFVVPQDPLFESGMGQLVLRSSGPVDDHHLAGTTAAASIAFQQWSGLQQLNLWNIKTPLGDIVVQLHDHNRISTFSHISTVFFGSF